MHVDARRTKSQRLVERNSFCIVAERMQPDGRRPKLTSQRFELCESLTCMTASSLARVDVYVAKECLLCICTRRDAEPKTAYGFSLIRTLDDIQKMRGCGRPIRKQAIQFYRGMLCGRNGSPATTDDLIIGIPIDQFLLDELEDRIVHDVQHRHKEIQIRRRKEGLPALKVIRTRFIYEAWRHQPPKTKFNACCPTGTEP
jgi:hypothetical protein